MKKSKYQFYYEIAPKLFLHYNSISNCFLLLKEGNHNEYENESVEELKLRNIGLYRSLVKKYFIVKDAFQETDFVLSRKKKLIFDSKLYNVVINTTLDCNLDCWYCYENRIRGSKLTTEIIEAIKKNIVLRYSEKPFSVLKISFFGGEPFLYFKGIKDILDFSREFCDNRKIELIADFTTNATLITLQRVEYLKQFRCHFQITLDGVREYHNRVKVCQDKNFDAYSRTINALKLISSHIKNHWIAVRINFDNTTLQEINNIIKDIDFIDRKKAYVILKKVWQLNTKDVNKDLLLEAIQKLFDKKFLVDYYIMPKGCVCFAERESQILFNYDGKIFKCTTISSFDDENALGKLDTDSGEITWDNGKISNWYKDMQPDYCKQCRWFPACLGICNKQIMANNGAKICTFDACNLTEEEYLMYLFKYQLLQKELNGEHALF